MIEQLKKRILITGAKSYIGTSLEEYLFKEGSELYDVFTIDVKNRNLTVEDFKGYDVVVNVAGIAHRKESKENKSLYYKVNRDLSISIGRLAKSAGVKHLIVISSMSVYGMITGYITKQTIPKPKSAYGDSKLQADKFLETLHDSNFTVSILRPPMVYGKNCKGNYQLLRKFATTIPIFPDYYNERSMVFIGNLCEFIKQVIDEYKGGLFFPQNQDYVSTSDMVRLIGVFYSKKIFFTNKLNFIFDILDSSIVKKVFGSLTYEKIDLIDKFSFEDSIRMS